MKNYYVYLLTDPRNNNKVFYCGKGHGSRWKSHLGHWSGNGKNNPTENKIYAIQREGLQPGVIFLHENIIDEDLAYRLEEEYIKENFEELTNVKILAKPPSSTGKPSPMKGKKHTIETKQKIRNTMLGQKRGPINDSWKKAISESLSKEKHPMWGKPAKSRKAIKELTTDTIFTDQLTAAKVLSIKQSDISNQLAGRQKSVKGYIFVYMETNK